MYYLQDGLGSIKHCKKLGKILGILFCIFTVLASFGIGNMGQINKITINFQSTFLSDVESEMLFGVSKVNLMIGVFLMCAMATILMGGFRRVAAVSEKLIPFMAIMYIAGCVVMVLIHVSKIPEIFSAIFRFAMARPVRQYSLRSVRSRTDAKEAFFPMKRDSDPPLWSTATAAPESRYGRECGE